MSFSPRAGDVALERTGARVVVLVEGRSDAAALAALATRLGRDLAADGAEIVSMSGVTNVGRFLGSARASGARVLGMCDAGEVRHFERALQRAGFGNDLTRDDLERLGFQVCEADLEDELIRALGPDHVERVLEANGELVSFRIFQRQPAQLGRPLDRQLRRFLGTRSGRKERYARLLVEALGPRDAPPPLARLLASI